MNKNLLNIISNSQKIEHIQSMIVSMVGCVHGFFNCHKNEKTNAEMKGIIINISNIM